jgi:2,4-dienoyl-CoA reductase-like NADH-dependent reductase (Old Yellow Enzyme family)
MANLFDPLKLGDITLKNRIFMAPLTRCRSTSSRIPNELMAEYYGQRAGAGLILTEATSICPQGVGYPATPGIWSAEQVAGWKKITTEVHKKEGKIFLQLWHVGRISDPYYLNGDLPVAPSAIASSGHVSLLRPQRNFVTPRALSTPEVKELVQTYKTASENAQKSGFDGVEIHAANGYLIDQFLQDSTNKRHDEYGGSTTNRIRFLLEILDAIISVWGASRVGVHLAPRCDSHSMGDSNPTALFSEVARELSKRQIAFICARESLKDPRVGPEIRKNFKGSFIANEGFDLQSGNNMLLTEQADAIAYGKLFISNPDLVERFRAGHALNAFNTETFYTEGAAGYTDYPKI